MACFRNPNYGNDHNTTQASLKGTPFESAYDLWPRVGHCYGFAVTPVKRRLLVTSAHLNMPVSSVVDIQGKYPVITKVTVTPLGMLMYLEIDMDVEPVELYRGAQLTTAHNLMHITGPAALGRGEPIYREADNLLIGWLPGDDATRKKRWGVNRLHYINDTPPNTQQNTVYGMFEDPYSQSIAAFNGDSGTPIFVDSGPNSTSPWQLVGITGGSGNEQAAKFDVAQPGYIGFPIWNDLEFIDNYNTDPTPEPEPPPAEEWVEYEVQATIKLRKKV